MEQKSKTHIRPIVYVMISVFLIIGYAYLTSSLTINGSTRLKKATWDVHFENIQVMDGSVTGEQVNEEPTITNDTTVSFHVNLKKPGDYYEFTVDAVNAGTIDAMIDTDVSFTIPDEFQDYIEATATYADGEDIMAHQQLLVDDIATYKVKVLFKTDIEKEDLPDNSTQLELDYTVEYIQRDDSAINRRAESTLYNVLKNEANSGSGLASKYTKVHQDSMDASKSIRNVYHWYASDDTAGETIKNKNNVIFAGHCWQILRTTDTGGVRLIYNGEVDNDQCLTTRDKHTGYAARTSLNLASNYWYGTDYTYDSNAKTFSISGTTEQSTWNASTGPNLIGKYTCKLDSVSGTCETLYLIESYYNATSAYAIPLNSDSNYSQFGVLQFNPESNSLSYAGYMYNTAYPYSTRTILSEENTLSMFSIKTTYWVADSVTCGDNNYYTLNNPYQMGDVDDYQDLVGKYTFRSESQTTSHSSAYYIVSVNEAWIYYLILYDNKPLSEINSTYTYGDSYTDNGDGTYTINNPATIRKTEWFDNYNNVGVGKYVCKNAINNTCSDLWYSKFNHSYKFSYFKISNTYKYANGFAWDGSKYILDDETAVNIWDINKTLVNNAHYTCWNSSGECTTLSFIYYIGYGNLITPYYISLNNGKSLETALDEMLYNDEVNSTNSIIKSGVDAWYKHYLLNDYDNYIEDTIYCNDRSIRQPFGWNPNGGDITTRLQYQHLIKDIKCENITDQFSVSNNKAKLAYKVGLISGPELQLFNRSTISQTGRFYWTGTPYYFDYQSGAVNWLYGTSGNFTTSVKTAFGVRPAISLKPGIIYTSGDGSVANPYIIDTN